MLSAKRNKRFCFFSGKEEILYKSLHKNNNSARPKQHKSNILFFSRKEPKALALRGSQTQYQTLNFVRVQSWYIRPMLSAKRNNAFCFFFRKKKNIARQLLLETNFRETEQHFLLLFLEKEEYSWVIDR
jgi:hypothetical protein